MDAGEEFRGFGDDGKKSKSNGKSSCKSKSNCKSLDAKFAKGAKFRKVRQEQRLGPFRIYFPTHDQMLSWMGHPDVCGGVGEERETAGLFPFGKLRVRMTTRTASASTRARG